MNIKQIWFWISLLVEMKEILRSWLKGNFILDEAIVLKVETEIMVFKAFGEERRRNQLGYAVINVYC